MAPPAICSDLEDDRPGRRRGRHRSEEEPSQRHDPADARRDGVGGSRGPEAFTAAADIRGLARALGSPPAAAWSLRSPWGDEIRVEPSAARGASDPRGSREAA